MQVYLVGGAVRDALLGRAVRERDYVVVGARPEELLAAGFRPVGADFPVFLHPETGHEYALARTERKRGRGYRGFVVDADPSVTLEDDLRRRDLTINAMAQAADGRLIDPYGGRRDLDARLLRHVSPAFAEDPVRILRVARFAARYAPLGFRVAPETLALMRAMVDSGEVDHLVPERVWAELRRALQEPRPSLFLRVLRACGALARIFPELDALYGIPQRAEFHPEIDTGLHQELVSDAAAALAPGDDLVGYCALVHDLGKALTPPSEWPRHRGHEERGLAPIAALSARLGVPREHRDLAQAICREHLLLHQWHELRPATRIEVFDRLDAWRRPERLQVYARVCHADKRGRLGAAHDDYPNAERMQRDYQAARAVTVDALLARGLRDAELGQALRRARVAAIAALSA